MIPFLYDSVWLTIQTVWIFFMVALLVGSYLAMHRLKRSRVNFTLFIENSGFFFITALIFARIVFFITNTDLYLPRFDLKTVGQFFTIWDQGFSFWGGLVGFVLALIYKLHKSEEKKWKWLDALTVPLIIGMMIGSLGNFLGGSAYGSPTNLPWGVTYEVYTVKYTVPVHPVQLYAIFIFGLILYVKQQIQKRTDFFKTEGNGTLFYCTALSLSFFFLEFFRGDDTLLVQGIRVPMICFFLLLLECGWQLYKRITLYKHPPHDQPV